ncbi:MAG TPA: sugar transferase [Pyrinomonadaceae bacterium]|nr:sugar transferase [Pyrinomonadaceae bacterium]
MKVYGRFLKRVVDVAISAGALVVLSPVMLLIAAAITLEDGRPVFFRQKRVGRGGELFEVFKFRSMPVATRNMPSAQAGQLKVTRVGKVIRRTNLDELPQLFNILRGEMSVVGPRPPLPSQLELCQIRETNGAIDCKPGLTGLAQINAYDGMPEKEKARWDGTYAAKLSFVSDMSIILRTFRYLSKRPPVY